MEITRGGRVWLKAHDCKSCIPHVGSNPTPQTNLALEDMVAGDKDWNSAIKIRDKEPDIF